uniref:DB domain-containing protein n=1 Tax=Panagrellus redivivus TaxID=6233 RepID=A0A7E4UTC4_PANRE
MLQSLLLTTLLLLQTHARRGLYETDYPILGMSDKNLKNSLASELFDTEEYVSNHMQNVHTAEHEQNVARANRRFAQCCTEISMPKECAERMCKYGQNPDFVRSAFFVFCDVDNIETITKLFRCVNHELDLYECCVRWTISHNMRMPKHCCRLYLSYPPQRIYFGHTLVRECYDIFEPMMVCPIHYY